MANERREEAERLARIARRQYGLLTASQLATIGLSRESVRRRVAAGVLVRVGERVYAVAAVPLSWQQSALAACFDLESFAFAVLSHQSAAAAWHLDVPMALPIHVTIPSAGSARSSRPGIVRHRSHTLEPSECTRIGCLPATTLTRTLVDLAAAIKGDVLARVVDDALARRLVASGRVLTAVEQHAGARRAGTRALRAALEPWLAGGRLDSVAEARFLRAITRAALPAPVVQRIVSDGKGFVARTDLAWPDQMLVLEIDGFRWHANPRSHARDSVRSNRLAASGWTVLHATPAELDASAAVILAALRRHLGTATASEQRPPAVNA